MSSRLPYLSSDFHLATQHPDTLKQWERQHYRHAQQRARSGTSVDLLAAAELALRCQDSSQAKQYLSQLLRQSPQEGDVHYLQALFLRLQGDRAGLLRYLNQCTPTLEKTTPDHARVHRLLAEELMREHNFSAASNSLRRAYALAGPVNFVHCTTREMSLSHAELAFDLELFDGLWPWDGEALQVRFNAIHTGSQEEVYVLEHRHRWVFCFDAAGHFIKGLGERDLAAVPFLHPELTWDLTDITVGPTGDRYLCGSADRVYVFDSQWSPKRYLVPPASQRSLRPLSLGMDAQGNTFVIYLHLGGIHWYNPEGFHMGSFGQNTMTPSLGKNYFCGLAISPQQEIALYDRQSIQIFQAGQSQARQKWEIPNLDLDAPTADDYPFCWNGISVDQNAFYVCDTYGNRVLQLKRESNQFQSLEGDWSCPFDVASAPSGTLYVADTGHGRVLKSQGSDWHVLLGHPAFQGAL